MQMKRFAASLVWVVWFSPLAPMPLVGTALAEDAPRYEFRDDHDPNGTGKFYMDREIAQVMGHLGAGWLERPSREREENPRLLLESLKIRPGDQIADIGAGSGYFTFRMSKLVGEQGSVHAVDIQPEMLTIIRNKAKEQGVNNIELVQGTPLDPKLPESKIDLILMVDVYHEFSHPWEMTTQMIKALRPGGRIVFVEYRLEDPSVPIKLVHKMTEKQVRKEMSVHQAQWIETLDVLPRQHVIVFQKPENGVSPAKPSSP
jgi:precorrin-6B methylase 2